MSEFLRKCNMQHHQQSLVNGGCVCGRLLRTYLRCSYDSVSRLLNLDARQLRKLGVKQGHATALMQAITAHKAEQEFARGRKHETADGVARNMHVAFKHYQRAMELGHKEAMVRVAAFYLRGYHVVKVDVARAKSLLEKALAMQAKGAAWFLGELLFDYGSRVEAKKIWECDPADPFCRAGLRLLDWTAGARLSESEFADLTTRASAGDIEAAELAAYCLQRCSPPNPTKAAALRQNAIDAGDALAQANQATASTDLTARMRWAKLAAEQRLPSALWLMHQLEHARSTYWLREAAKAGSRRAQTQLGKELIARNSNSGEGRSLLQRAADAGCEEAAQALSNLADTASKTTPAAPAPAPPDEQNEGAIPSVVSI